jgi:hypothetical protein
MSIVYRTVLINLLLKPKKAFGTIYTYGLYKYTWPFFVLMGISGKLSAKLFILADSRNEIFLQLSGYVVWGALVGWVGFWIFTMLISVTGKWLDGRADSDELFDITSYAAIASVITLLSTIICLYLLRHAGYTDGKYPHTWDNIFYRIERVHHYIDSAGGLYFFILMVIGVSVAQGFNIARAILNIILPFAILMAAFFVAIEVAKLFV